MNDSYNKKMLKIETDFKNNREKYKDPQTERMIPFEIYVPIPMKVCYIDSNKVGNIDKQVIANMIMRNLLHFLRNNNGTWNKLQKDVLFSEDAWKKLNDNTQTRKSAIKPAI